MRRRDHIEWGISTQYEDESFFLEIPVGEGMHSIYYGEDLADLLIRDRSSRLTVVALHPPLSDGMSYPQFVGDPETREAGVNLVALSDPSAAHSVGDFSEDGVLDALARIVSHAVESIGVDEVIVYGEKLPTGRVNELIRKMTCKARISRGLDLKSLTHSSKDD